MNENIFIGLVVISIAIGHLTTTPIGWLVFGSGILLVGFVECFKKGRK